MTRREQADQAADQLCGILLDAITAGRTGGEAFIWLRVQAAKVRKMCLELSGEPVPPPSNGAAKPKTEVKK